MGKNKQKIVFDLPKETIVVDVIYEILKNNGLKESDEDFFSESSKIKESQTLIVRDATLVILQKKISEKKLVELLQQHLETSKETAEKIVVDIKQKLIPFAKIIGLPEEKIKETPKTQNEKEDVGYDKEVFREELLKKIGGNLKSEEETYLHQDSGTTKKELPTFNVKKIDIKNVERNAEQMEQEGKNTIIREKDKLSQKTELNKLPQTQESKQDTYREPTE